MSAEYAKLREEWSSIKDYIVNENQNTLQEILKELKALHIDNAAIKEEIKKYRIVIDEQGSDIIKIADKVDIVSSKLDICDSIGPDQSNTSRGRRTGLTGKTKMIITSYFKAFYMDNAKHKLQVPIDNIELKGSPLEDIGITADIINYVRTNKNNPKTNKKDILEKEGSLIYKELKDREKKNPNGPASKILKAIKENHEQYKRDFDKNEAVSLKKEIVSIKQVKKVNKNDCKENNNEDSDFVNNDDF